MICAECMLLTDTGKLFFIYIDTHIDAHTCIYLHFLQHPSHRIALM